MTSRTLRHVAASLGFLFALTFAWATPVKFDIPSQPAASAIKAFIKQSKAQVAYRSEELEGLKANEVKGEFEPDVALTALLKDTGCAITRRDSGIFVVTKAVAPVTTGSVRGVLTGEGGKGMPNVLISIRETAESTETNRFGEYVFPKVAAGTYVLVASATGYQTMHIAEVQIRAGRELLIGKEEMRKAKEGPLALEPFVVNADTVEELDKIEVTGAKQKPFSAGNMDIERTINDAQPRYIFDAEAIERSGDSNIENFLKNNLTMNTVAQANSQVASLNLVNGTSTPTGNISSINLRGLGTDKTLILINGRRAPEVVINGTSLQPDLNGIPMGAIDRIEILPSSASGIYGGSAIGGVVNVILKKDYSGGELRAIYDNTWDTDSPSRTASLSYGFALEDGKTHVSLSASWSDTTPMLLQDRRGLLDQNIAIININEPNFFYSGGSPLGALPNIAPSLASVTGLTLKIGGALGARITHVPAGTSPATSPAALAAALKGNAGLWNFDLPPSTQRPTGLFLLFGAPAETRSIRGSVRRQMLPKIEAFVELSYNENQTASHFMGQSVSLTVPVASPANPFLEQVTVKAPDTTELPLTTRSVSGSLSVGAIAQLPRGWVGEIDYSHSENRFEYYYHLDDATAKTADLLSGVLNPFVDTLQYPLGLEKYARPIAYHGISRLQDVALRGAGPVFGLPWGDPSLVFGLEYRTAQRPDNTQEFIYPLSPARSNLTTFFGKEQVTKSGYVEATLPLVKKNWRPLIRALEVQIAGRKESYEVDTGTSSSVTNFSTGVVQYSGPTLDGRRYYAKASYASSNGTLGIKYQPHGSITVRASLATAFLPPTPTELADTPVQSTALTMITDPVTGARYGVQTVTGGNPALTPQNSESLNVGIIWEPRGKFLHGLRLNAEYYQIEQNNAIGSLSAQQFVTFESTYPDRVTRDGAGTITLVDRRSINLYKRETEGFDLSLSHTAKTGLGKFYTRVAGSIILRLKNQYSLTLPSYESAGHHPTDGGAARYKSNLTLGWESDRWSASWTTRYFGSYKQYGVAGGPVSIQSFNGAAYTHFILAQGSETISSQIYHDLVIGYRLGKTPRGAKTWSAIASKLGAGMSLQVGVRNMFNKAPPLDVAYSTNYYLSPYGDTRLCSYWLSVKKSF